ncbi:ROK family protein [Bacteroides sp. OttesenSCG-928-D19]|nr:ROK family protein [Bacteroides sp. OttesenSCG-928-D19]
MKIGIDLGGTNVRAGVVHQGNIIRKIAEPCRADESEKEVTDHIISMIWQLMTDQVESIGIGVPSVVDVEKGIVYNVANIPSWVKVPLRSILEKEFGISVAINNDCNCLALGEHKFGEGMNYKDIVCVAMGTGVGAGIIINGKLYNGHNIGAGEIGCLPYLEHDYEYYCGSLFFSQKHNFTGKDAFLMAQKGDLKALQLWEQMGLHIGELIKVILFTYDPQIIILGGSISNAYAYFSPAMYKSIQNFPYPKTIERIRITTSQKEDIALLGASEL